MQRGVKLVFKSCMSYAIKERQSKRVTRETERGSRGWEDVSTHHATERVQALSSENILLTHKTHKKAASWPPLAVYVLCFCVCVWWCSPVEQQTNTRSLKQLCPWWWIGVAATTHDSTDINLLPPTGQWHALISLLGYYCSLLSVHSILYTFQL